MVPDIRTLLLVRVLSAGQGGAGRRRGWQPAVVERTRWAFGARRCPLCPVMPQVHVETFRAPTMITGTFGQYLAETTQDHETTRAEAASLSSWYCFLNEVAIHVDERCGMRPGQLG